jgi:hypothetical protein
MWRSIWLLSIWLQSVKIWLKSLGRIQFICYNAWNYIFEGNKVIIVLFKYEIIPALVQVQIHIAMHVLFECFCLLGYEWINARRVQVCLSNCIKQKKGLGLVFTIVIHIANLPRCFSAYANEYEDILFVSTHPLIFIYISFIWALVIEIWYVYDDFFLVMIYVLLGSDHL